MDVVGLVSLKDWIQIHHFSFSNNKKRNNFILRKTKHQLFILSTFCSCSTLFYNPQSHISTQCPLPWPPFPVLKPSFASHCGLSTIRVIPEGIPTGSRILWVRRDSRWKRHQVRVWIPLGWEEDPSSPWIPVSAEAPWPWADWKTQENTDLSLS